LRLLDGFFIPAIYHANRRGKESFFKVAHCPGRANLDIVKLGVKGIGTQLGRR
jgi:hypothetical protein